MVTRLRRIVIYRDGLQRIKSHKTLIIFSWKITSQNKIILSPLPQSLWPPNLEGWWLTRGAPGHKVTWCSDNKALQDHVINENHCISTMIVPMGTKLGRMLTYLDEPLPIKSHDHDLLIPLFTLDPLKTKSWGKLKLLYLYYDIGYVHQTR